MKRLLCIILTLTMMCSLSLLPSSAQSNPTSPAFKSIDELRSCVTNIFNENYDELVSIAKSLDYIPEEDEYITYGQNCGPCTTAFQKILYDNSIVVEANKAYLYRDHIFNVLRTSYTETPDTVTTVVIDTTYKQFVTAYYTSKGYQYEDIAEDLPPVLIYEYGNYDQLADQLKTAQTRLGDDTFVSMCEAVFKSSYNYEYLPQDFQQVDEKDKMSYSPNFIEDLRSKSGSYDKKLNEALFLTNTQQNFKKEFIYDSNGVYRLCVSANDLTKLSSGVYITNSDGEAVFGAKDEASTIRCIPSTPNAVSGDMEVALMEKGSQHKLQLNTDGVFLPLLISIDLRAGEESPAIYAYTVSKVLTYSDVDTDGEINITDVTKLQMALAKYPEHALDDYQKETANILKTDTLNIFSATEISQYLAGYESEKCGQYMYFSPTLELGCSKNIGYIDMTVNLTE